MTDITPTNEQAKAIQAIVYQIACALTGKLYIGWTTKSLSERWERHLRCDKASYLQRCIKKYGRHNFSISPLFEFEDSADAIAKERELIAAMRLNICRFPDGCGMNMTDGGEGTIGYVPTAEHKASLSAAMRGKKKSLRHAENIRRAKLGQSNPMYGRPPTETQVDSARRRFTESNPNKKGGLSHRYGKQGHMLGKKHSPETIEKMRAKQQGRPRKAPTDETKRKIGESLRRTYAADGHPSIGKKRSEESRIKMRVARLACVERQRAAGLIIRHSEETKEKQRRAALLRVASRGVADDFTTNRKELP